jgi:hypothetical protein
MYLIQVFPWDSKTKTTTLLREYQPGPNAVLYGTVAGMFEKDKHQDPLECAQFELEEEAHLETTQWVIKLPQNCKLIKTCHSLT